MSTAGKEVMAGNSHVVTIKTAGLNLALQPAPPGSESSILSFLLLSSLWVKQEGGMTDLLTLSHFGVFFLPQSYSILILSVKGLQAYCSAGPAELAVVYTFKGQI